ncbi:MAG TPA: hypothetical protein VG672_24510 [Bryobacteraceae bacterium]|nr:hypothetical protein [Bryobacteraceae bacterium]
MSHSPADEQLRCNWPLAPRLRKAGLAAHIVCSVAWIGAVAAFLALSISGLTSQNVDLVRGDYLAMNLVGEFILLPLSALALVTGLVQALGTEWGLLRYYWVVVKLVLTLGATFLLALHQFAAVAAAAARVARSSSTALPQLGGLGPQLVGDAAFGLAVLLVIATVSVFKPWGRIPSKRPGGQPRQEGADRSAKPLGTPRSLKVFLVIAAVIGIALALLRHLGSHFGHHGH